MKENESLVRQESPGPISRKKLNARRKLEVEEHGDGWRGKQYSGIGKWPTQARFHPGQKAGVMLISPGIMQLRAIHGYVAGEGAESSLIPRQTEFGPQTLPPIVRGENGSEGERI